LKDHEKLCNLGVLLLKRLARIKFETCDAEALFEFCCSNSNPSIYLGILCDVAELVDPEMAIARCYDMHSVLLQIHEPSIHCKIFTILHNLPGCFKPNALIMVMQGSGFFGEMFDFLLEKASHYPRFLEILAQSALNVRKKCFSELLPLCDNGEALQAMRTRPTWLVWLLLLAFQGDPTEGVCIIQFLARRLSDSPLDVKLITYMIIYLDQRLTKSSNRDLLLDFLQEVRVATSNPETMSDLVTLALAGFLFHSGVDTHTRPLVEEFNHSIFADEQFRPIHTVARRQSVRNCQELVAFVHPFVPPIAHYSVKFEHAMLADQPFLNVAITLMLHCEGHPLAGIVKGFSTPAVRRQMGLSPSISQLKQEFKRELLVTVQTVASGLEIEFAEADSLMTTAATRRQADGLQKPAIVEREVSRAIQRTKPGEKFEKRKSEAQTYVMAALSHIRFNHFIPFQLRISR
jgi:hypothetical protein